MKQKTIELLIAVAMKLEADLLNHPKISNKYAFDISVFSFFISSQCYISHMHRSNRFSEIIMRPEIVTENISELLRFAFNYCAEKDRSFLSFNKERKIKDRLGAYTPYTEKYYVLTTMLNNYTGNKLDPLEKTEISAFIEEFSIHTLMMLEEFFDIDSYDDISDMPAPKGPPKEGGPISDTSKPRDYSSLKLY